MPGEIAGFDKTAVEQWLAQHVPSLDQTLSWERLEGGHSNLTYALTGEDGTRAVIRRPPEGELLPKAHDMAREWRVLEALSSTDVPVAKPLAFCDDQAVAGANFYVMGFIEGKPFYEADELREWIPIERRPAMAANMVEALVALHAVDPVSVGLERHGRPDGYIERQLRSWYGSWNASIEAADIDEAYVHEMHDRLAADIPTQGAASIVHGDYMVHNVMFDQEGNVTAIVDWEISTLGDPLADLAYLLNGWVAADDVPAPQETAPTVAEGLPSRTDLAAQYAELSGRNLDRLAYYSAFNYFKTACILHGVYARYRNGQKAIEPEDLEELRTRTLRAVERVGQANDELSSP